MENTQYIVAIEVGSSKIVGAIAEKYQSGNIQVNCLEEEKMLNSVRYGCVQNVESVKNAVTAILQRLENRIDGKINDVFVGLGGRSLHSIPAELQQNVSASDTISEAMVQAIIKAAGKEPLRDYEVVGMEPRAFYVDNVETKNPVGTVGTQLKVVVNRIVAKPMVKTILNRVMQHCCHVRRYLVTPLCLGRNMLTPAERSLGTMLVDFGAETTTVAIYKGDYLVYVATLPLGGRNITRDIQNGIGSILEDTAERVKRSIAEPLDPNADAVTIDGVDSQEATRYIEARVGEIVANINQQIIYAGLKTGDIKNIVLTGGSSQLKGFAQKLADVTKLQVRMGSYPAALSISDQRLNRVEYYGLYAVLAQGAAVIGDASCVERNNYDDGPVFNAPTSNPAPTMEPKPATKPSEPKKKKKSIFGKWISGVVDAFNEKDDEE